MRNIFILLVCVASFLCSSCKTQTDENGDLGGMWQLVERRDNAGKVMSDAPVVYFRIQFHLMQLTPIHDGKDPIAHFEHTPDSLILLEVFDNARKDSFNIPFVELTDFYGVPSDGRFHIDQLDS
ncbi:MAG: lipocalin-like domain-containing protein, partial [Bacteroidaceae bacterium]|nr:lipocalin-like domain-containing protein [Bacteroidaceae bacterium]